MKKLLLISLILVGCTKAPQPGTTEYIEEQEMGMNCVKVGHLLYRCENKEAVCYKLYEDDLQCHFKNAWAHEGAE